MFDAKSCCRPACAVLLLIHSASEAQLTFTLSPVAGPGDRVPAAMELVSTPSASLNDNGSVAFTADGAIFLQANGSTSAIASFGDPAPGGGTLIDAFGPVLSATGQVLFAADLASPGRSGLLVWSEGSLQSIAQIGDPAPGGGYFSFLLDYSINGAGDIAFSAALGPLDEGLFLFSQGSLTLLARRGDPAPRGDTFVHFYGPVMNINRQIAFGSFLSNMRYGIFLRAANGEMTAVVREGDPAPEGPPFDFSFAPPHADHRLPARTSRDRRGRAEAMPWPPSWIASDAANDVAAVLYPGLYPTINDAGIVAFWASASVYDRGGIFQFSKGEITRRVREGQLGPGGEILSSLSDPIMNSAGETAFEALVSQSQDQGVFLLSGDSITEIARSHRPSPEGDRFTFIAYYPFSLNAAGQLTFQSELENSLGGVYLFSNGALTRIAGQGDPIGRDPTILSAQPETIDAAGNVVFRGQSFPGQEELFDGRSTAPIAGLGGSAISGGVFDNFSAVATNANGQTVFVGHTSGGSSGLYSLSEGVLTRIVGTGDPAPGGGVFDGVDDVAINNAGDLAFVAYGDFASGGVVFLLSGGQYRRLVAAGDPAPRGGVFTYFAYLSLNDAGQVAFLGFVARPTARGVFLWSKGTVQAIAQTGDPAPGGGAFSIPGITLRGRYSPALNAAGQVVFGSRLVEADAPSVFLFSADGLIRIAGPGDPAPGGGVFVYARSGSLNDLGEVTFAASLDPSGFGLYFRSSEGTLTKIVATGDPTPDGATFLQVEAPKLNSQTQVAFRGTTSLFGTNAVYLATSVR